MCIYCTSSPSGFSSYHGQSLTTLLAAASEPLPISSSSANTLTTSSFSNSNSSSSFGAAASGLQPNALATAPNATAPSPQQPRQVEADFNSDGQTDLIWRNYATGQNAVWLLNGTTHVSTLSLASVSDLNWRIQGARDFTGDGKTDVLWRNYATGQNIVWALDGTTLTSVLSQLPIVSDLNWQIQGTADFTNDGKTDLLWRNYATGQNAIWSLNGATLHTAVALPSLAGVNLRIQAAADFNQDGDSDILWRNELSGENFVWSMTGTSITSTTFLPTQADLNWQIQGAVDVTGDGKTDLLWRNSASGENAVWAMDDLTPTNQAPVLTVGAIDDFTLTSQTPALTVDRNWAMGLQDTLSAPSLVNVSARTFSGLEGDTGTFKLELTQAPTTNVTLTFSAGTFVVVDADGSVASGTQTSLTFTPQDWNQARTVRFIAEVDNSTSDRILGNTVSYTLSGGLTGSATYDLGRVTNTYAPDPTRFNIDLDFRNDYSGFWTLEKRAIAQKAASDWSTRIANEWTDFQLDDQAIGRLDNFSSRPYSFTSKRTVDDLLVFVNPYQSSSSQEPAIGGPDYQYGGWITSPDLMPRVGQIAINASSFSSQNDPSGWLLYQVVLHELGHVLGLVGLNWAGYNLEDRTTPQTAVFKGEYARAANGGTYVGLQSQDGANPVTGAYDYSHPASDVQSVMSYGWIYNLYGPSNIDYAMLADSGYRVSGFNA